MNGLCVLLLAVLSIWDYPARFPAHRQLVRQFVAASQKKDAEVMEAVCRKLDISGQVSLEERMGCGCGICFGCTCHTADGPKRVCFDGPVFKKEEVIW